MVASRAHLIEGSLLLPCTDGTWAPPGCLLITFPIVWYIAVAALKAVAALLWCDYPFLVVYVSWRETQWQWSNWGTEDKVDRLSVVVFSGRTEHRAFSFEYDLFVPRSNLLYRRQGEITTPHFPPWTGCVKGAYEIVIWNQYLFMFSIGMSVSAHFAFDRPTPINWLLTI